MKDLTIFTTSNIIHTRKKQINQVPSTQFYQSHPSCSCVFNVKIKKLTRKWQRNFILLFLKIPKRQVTYDNKLPKFSSHLIQYLFSLQQKWGWTTLRLLLDPQALLQLPILTFFFMSGLIRCLAAMRFPSLKRGSRSPLPFLSKPD